jgi:hypothetical protein
MCATSACCACIEACRWCFAITLVSLLSFSIRTVQPPLPLRAEQLHVECSMRRREEQWTNGLTF